MSIIEKSIEVNVPEYTAYAQWTRYRVEQKMQVSREEERNQLRLNTGQDAAITPDQICPGRSIQHYDA